MSQHHQGESSEPKRPQPQKPLPIIYPDADPHNANWLRILAQRRQEEETKTKQKENPTDGDIQ